MQFTSTPFDRIASGLTKGERSNQPNWPIHPTKKLRPLFVFLPIQHI